jgi:sugar/nucleoside kinase (ribokinase family)
MKRQIQVFGPAYLDRVVRLDGPLLDPRISPPLDQSVDGGWKFGEGLTLIDPDGRELSIALPADWPGPSGSVALSHPLVESDKTAPWRREVRATSWQDDLGGMGAGYAAALGGALISALGPEDDPASVGIAALLASHGINHSPVRRSDHAADWTLLLTSGAFGDKLPIGFRGCHAALDLAAVVLQVDPECPVRVVASLPNALSEPILRQPGAAVRFFAPAIRNMRDRECPISRFADAIDIISCNRREWESLADREEVAWRVSILAITDGPRGSRVRFTTPSGEPGLITVPAFERALPPRDTNRAGEAYAATLLTTLLDAGWRPGVAEEELVAQAATRAGAAAALVLDRLEFGFPAAADIDRAVGSGRIDAPPDGAAGAVRYNAPRQETVPGEEPS